MLPNELTQDIKTRLTSIRGQVDGLIKLLNTETDPEKIIIQFKAADQALQKAHCLLLDEVFRKSLALKLVEVINTCPGNCQDAEKIEYIKKQFPTLGLDELSSKIKEINAIEKRLEEYKKKS